MSKHVIHGRDCDNKEKDFNPSTSVPYGEGVKFTDGDITRVTS